MLTNFLLLSLGYGRTLFYHQNLGIINQFNKHTTNEIISEFDSFNTRFDRKYTSNNDYWYRYSIFEENYNHISEHNTKMSNYQLGLNQFTDMLPEEYPMGYLGYPFFRNPENYYYHISSGYNKLNYSSIDWRADGQVTNVKNQAECGSCWAFSAVATIEGAHKRNTSRLVSLSEQDLVDCVPDCYGCGGGWPYLAIEYIMNGTLHNITKGNPTNFTHGIDTETYYPYQGIGNPCNFSNSSNAVGSQIYNLTLIRKNDTQSLIDAVLRVGPISVAINAGGDFQMYLSGIYSPQDCDPTELDHAVTVVGYGQNEKGEKYFIVKNSWGTNWGMDGYIYMSADTPNLCGIAMDACYAS